MANISNIQAPYSLTTDFKSVFLPLYTASSALKPPSQHKTLNTPNIPKIGQLGLNIYSPSSDIPHYEQLLCAEMARKKNDYDSHQPIKLFWFAGSPLKQLSPEAITELCFRFSNHFPHSNDLNTIRGISVTASELNKTTLALLAGLKFSCVEIYIDATIASNDRSVGKIETGLRLMSDYQHIKLNVKIRFSDQSHPDFLTRLLSLLEGANCQQIELVCTRSSQDGTASSSPPSKLGADSKILLEINKRFDKPGWVSCGNNVFFASQHENYSLYKQKKLLLTPWGYHSQAILTQLGVGVGALSMTGDTYELNTSDPDTYQQCISNNKALPTTQYQLGDCSKHLILMIQQLVCYHQVDTNPVGSNDLFSPLIKQEWLEATGDIIKLTDLGLVNLNTIAKFLFSHANNEGYNTGAFQNP